jgi:hypothetical protein
MAAIVHEGAQKLRWTQYDGSNGADVAAALDAVFVSDVGGVLSFTLNGDGWTMETGQWFVQVWDLSTAVWQAWGRFSSAELANKVMVIPAQA